MQRKASYVRDLAMVSLGERSVYVRDLVRASLGEGSVYVRDLVMASHGERSGYVGKIGYGFHKLPHQSGHSRKMRRDPQNEKRGPLFIHF